MSRSPNGKLEMKQIFTQGQGNRALIYFLSQFPPESPTTLLSHVTSSLSQGHPTCDFIVPDSLSHTLPDFVQSSLLCLTLSLTPESQTSSNRPLSVSHSKNWSRVSWRDEGKNWFSIPSFVFFCLMVVIRDKKMIWVCCESMFIFWVFYN